MKKKTIELLIKVLMVLVCVILELIKGEIKNEYGKRFKRPVTSDIDSIDKIVKLAKRVAS